MQLRKNRNMSNFLKDIQKQVVFDGTPPRSAACSPGGRRGRQQLSRQVSHDQIFGERNTASHDINALLQNDYNRQYVRS